MVIIQNNQALSKINQEKINLLISDELMDKLDELAEKNKIEEDVYEIIIDEVVNVIIGSTSEDEFLDSLKSYGIDDELSKLVNREIKILVFDKLGDRNSTGINLGVINLEEKAIEISKKYGLDQKQQETIIQIINNHLGDIDITGAENEISERLNVSKLLSEQIVIDINKRIFEQKGRVKNISTNTTLQNEKLMSYGTQLELRPENLPVVEKNEPLKVNPVPTQPQKPVFQNEVLDKQIPIGVPRYAETTKPAYVNPVIEKKINTITSTPAPAKYEKDPYREPLN